MGKVGVHFFLNVQNLKGDDGFTVGCSGFRDNAHISVFVPPRLRGEAHKLMLTLLSLTMTLVQNKHLSHGLCAVSIVCNNLCFFMGFQRYCEWRHLSEWNSVFSRRRFKNKGIKWDKKQLWIIRHPETSNALRLIWMFLAPVKGLKAVTWTHG